MRKAHDDASMRQTVNQIEEEGLANHGILLETYVSGPEVGINLVLWSGEILFFEVSDDFPSAADAETATINDSFNGINMVLLNALDPKEIQPLRSSLHVNLLQLGLSTGVFRVKARIQYSFITYRKSPEGILDLTTRMKEDKEPRVFLIEVNLRPLSIGCTFSSLYTYGVDYCGIHLLRAVGDQERYKILSKSFSNLAQYWCANLQVPIHRVGVVVPNDSLIKSCNECQILSRT